MPSWTLQYVPTSQTKTFEDWGIDEASILRTCRSQAVSTVTFQLTKQSGLTEIAPFAFGQTCILKRAGVSWFYGRVTAQRRSGQGQSEEIAYELSDPWWYLENLAFRQDWNMASNPSSASSAIVPIRRGRVILGHTLAGSRQHSGAQIIECLQYAIDMGAPIQIGTIDPNLEIPYSEHKGITVAEAITFLLHFSPDAVCWFDYSFNPPKIHIRNRGNLSPVNLILTSGGPGAADDLVIIPRHDLQVPGVIIEYEKTHSLNEFTWSETSVDQAGSHTFGSIVAPVELGGSNTTFQSQQLVVSAFNATDLNFWKAIIPRLADANVTGLTVVSATPANGNWVTGGAVPSWLPALATQLNITAELDYTIQNTHGASEKREKEMVSIQVTTTSLGSIGVHTFEQVTSFTAEEPTPVGLADGIYGALQLLQYEGSVSFVDEDVGDLSIGNTLNLHGGRGEWTSMRASIQQITDGVGQGRTTVQFGPPRHLTVQDFVELLRMFRYRVRSSRLQERVDGKVYGSGQVSGPILTPVQNSNNSAGGVVEMTFKKDPAVDVKVTTIKNGEVTVIKVPATNAQGVFTGTRLLITQDGLPVIDLDLADTFPIATGTIKLREFDVCEDGVAKKVLLLASPTYT